MLLRLALFVGGSIDPCALLVLSITSLVHDVLTPVCLVHPLASVIPLATDWSKSPEHLSSQQEAPK